MSFDTQKYTKSPFIRGEDLEEGEKTVVTIASAEETTFPSGDTIPVLSFLELQERLTLNKTRVKRLCELLGEDTNDWINQRIALYAVPVQYNGKSVMSVAVGKAPARAKAKTSVDNDVEFEQPAKKRPTPQPAVEFEGAAPAKRRQVAEEEESPF